MSAAKIERITLPDVEPHTEHLYSSDGNYLGRMVYEGKTGQMTSRLELANGLLPYRVMQSKRKYRQ